MHRGSANAISLAILALGLSAAAPAWAQDGPAGWYFEVYTGSHQSDIEGLDESTPYGLRIGVKPEQGKFGLEASIGNVDGTIKDRFEGPTGPVDVEFETQPIDVSLSFWAADSRRFQFLIFAGLGWAFGEATARFPIDEENNIDIIERLNDDSFTANFGLGARVFVSETVYIRLDARGRWYDKRGEDDLDQEYTLGLGFSF